MPRPRSSSYTSPSSHATWSPMYSHRDYIYTPFPKSFPLPPVHVIQTPSPPTYVQLAPPPSPPMKKPADWDREKPRRKRARSSSQSVLPSTPHWPTIDNYKVLYPPQPRSAMRRTNGPGHGHFDDDLVHSAPSTPYKAGPSLHLRSTSDGFHPFPSHHHHHSNEPQQHPQPYRRRRRHSSSTGVHFATEPQYIEDGQVLRSYPTVPFYRKGAVTRAAGGIHVAEALKTKLNLSLNDHYPASFFHPNEFGRLVVRVEWDGYGRQDYHINLDTSTGKVNLNRMVKHIARGCEEFVHRYRIPIALDYIRLHYIEEIRRGIWSLKLSV